MNKYGTKTKLKTSDVIKKAINFFGEGGLGLEITDMDNDRVCLKGAGGFVTVIACPNDEAEVDIETREWDHQVKEFMREL